MILRITLATILSALLTHAALSQSTAAQTCDELASHPYEPGHEGRGVEWGYVDVLPAIAACRAALAQSPDSPETLYRLARTLMQAEQYGEAMPMMLRAAEAGYSPAETAYGTAYLGNQGVLPDLPIAFQWLTRAAESGHPIGQYNLGLLHGHGPETYFNPLLAKSLYEKSAEQGYPLAMFNLGVMYDSGDAVERNLKRSFSLFTRAAELGDIRAVHAVGRAYSNGRGVWRDDAKAFEWWMRSAEAGYAPSQVDVARALLNGRGVASDGAAALNWYRDSASTGYTFAQIELGRRLVASPDPSEKAEGVEWLKRAGDAGDLEGYQSLAEHYAGNNLLPLARHYAEIVAAHGDDQLKEYATGLLASLDGLEANRRKALAAEPWP